MFELRIPIDSEALFGVAWKLTISSRLQIPRRSASRDQEAESNSGAHRHLVCRLPSMSRGCDKRPLLGPAPKKLGYIEPSRSRYVCGRRGKAQIAPPP